MFRPNVPPYFVSLHLVNAVMPTRPPDYYFALDRENTERPVVRTEVSGPRDAAAGRPTPKTAEEVMKPAPDLGVAGIPLPPVPLRQAEAAGSPALRGYVIPVFLARGFTLDVLA